MQWDNSEQKYEQGMENKEQKIHTGMLGKGHFASVPQIPIDLNNQCITLYFSTRHKQRYTSQNAVMIHMKCFQTVMAPF